MAWQVRSCRACGATVIGRGQGNRCPGCHGMLGKAAGRGAYFLREADAIEYVRKDNGKARVKE